jgi:hypothetical protein
MTQNDLFGNLESVYNEIEKEYQEQADSFWDNLSYEDRCNAFHAVVERLHKGEIELDASYRYVLYDIFGFDEAMYFRAMQCGYMDLHNSINK